MNTLTVGAQGPEVCVLQTRLNAKPSTGIPLSADGLFGGKTLIRVREYQRSAALTVDGIVGPKTWAKLLSPEPTPKKAARYCDDVCRGNLAAAGSGMALSLQAAASSARSGLASVASLLPSLPSAPKVRVLTAAEKGTATGVYGSSIDFSSVLISDKTGIGGRAFVLAVPVPFSNAIQVMNLGPSFSRDTLIHELAHVWQSQHHSSPTQYMVNAVASQGLAEAVNLAKGSVSFSAYAYRPGKPFGEYGAEQIAQQVMRGEAPIVAHVKSVAARAVDPGNVASLKTPRVEDWSLPGVKI